MSNRPNTLIAAKPAIVSALSTDIDVVLNQLIAEHRCPSQFLHYEARGEGRISEQSAAEVVFRRMRAGNFGHCVRAIVYEGSGHPGRQFSSTCNGDLDRPRDESAWMKSEQLAAQILTGEIALHNSASSAFGVSTGKNVRYFS
jgi:spore germination cell wall hydrolase CwlJ-like protein